MICRDWGGCMQSLRRVRGSRWSVTSRNKSRFPELSPCGDTVCGASDMSDDQNLPQQDFESELEHLTKRLNR